MGRLTMRHASTAASSRTVGLGEAGLPAEFRPKEVRAVVADAAV
jgi:hypothetical protein